MKQIAVFLLLWTVSVWAVAQSSSTNPSNPAPQTYVIPAAPGGVSTNTGTAIIVAQPTAPLVVTPEMHLTTVNPSVGASNATAGNTAGAANATTSMPVSPRIVTTVPQFATAGASVLQTLPPPESQPAAPAYNAAGGTISGTPVMVVNNGVLFDRGVGSGSSVVAGEAAGGESLGQIARQNRQHEATASAHVYTNSDIDRINAQPATGGLSGMAVGAGNETQPPPASNNPPAVAQPSPNPPPNPGVSQPVPPASATPPPKQQSQEKQLPSGSSNLPLMTAVGILATGAGLLAK